MVFDAVHGFKISHPQILNRIAITSDWNFADKTPSNNNNIVKYYSSNSNKHSFMVNGISVRALNAGFLLFL